MEYRIITYTPQAVRCSLRLPEFTDGSMEARCINDYYSRLREAVEAYCIEMKERIGRGFDYLGSCKVDEADGCIEVSLTLSLRRRGGRTARKLIVQKWRAGYLTASSVQIL